MTVSDGAQVFQVSQFSRNNLRKAFLGGHDGPDRSSSLIESKRQLTYLFTHLSSLECKTIVAEYNYVDRDFLEDHSVYYVKCFKPYSRLCTRLHFFSSRITRRQFARFVSGDEFVGIGDDTFLGFVVIKPLPEAFIGRTCLAPYPKPNQLKVFPAVQNCRVHLAGREFIVKSLLFQEQDTVLAACATTAIWSALQRTGHLFRHSVPTPCEITTMATRSGGHRGRVFPSLGLELGQMCEAFQAMGLDTELRGDGKYELKEFVYAYAAFGLPVILGLEDKGAPLTTAHAVTVVGYSLTPKRARQRVGSLLLRASRMNSLYVHDDQSGPFVQADIINRDTIIMPKPVADEFKVFAILVPVYRKIRIRYEKVLSKLTGLADILYFGGAALGLPIPDIEWDVRLSLGTEFQKGYRGDREALSQSRRRVLGESFPRFVWLSTGSGDNNFGLDIVVDATDIERGFPATRIYPRSKNCAAALKAIAADYSWLEAVARTHHLSELKASLNRWRSLLSQDGSRA